MSSALVGFHPVSHTIYSKVGPNALSGASGLERNNNGYEYIFPETESQETECDVREAAAVILLYFLSQNLFFFRLFVNIICVW